MTTTILPVFQNTLTKTDVWLSEISGELGWHDKKKAWTALRSVLHALRDRLTIEEATDLAAQMPMLIRGMYFEGWSPSKPLSRIRKAEELVDLATQNFNAYDLGESLEPEDIVRSVLKVLARHVSAGEIKDVISSLPEGLRELWDWSDR